MTKLKNVRIVILKVLTHVRTHPEELLVSKIWISCFLFRLRFFRFEEIVWRKEAGVVSESQQPHTFQHCIAQRRNNLGRDYEKKQPWKPVEESISNTNMKHGIAQAWGLTNNSMALRRLEVLKTWHCAGLVLKTTRQRTLHWKSWENECDLVEKKGL